MNTPDSLPTLISHARPGLLRRLPGYFGDAGLLVVVIFALPVAIIVVGMPIALLARFGMAILLGW